MDVTIYSTRCPQCNMLESNLKRKNIPFTLVEGAGPIRELGYKSAPLLKVDDKIMTFAEAVRWVNAFEEVNEHVGG